MRCKTCNSPEPHEHPAVQSGGEVVICADTFHLIPTPQNLPEYIEAVHEAIRINPTKAKEKV